MLCQGIVQNDRRRAKVWCGWVCCKNDINRGRRCGDNNSDCRINMLMLLS